MAEFKKRYRNDKGQFVATRVIENVRQFYKENFTPEDRAKINLYDQIRKMDKTTLQQTSRQGAGLFVTDPIMYVGFSDNPTTQIDYVQKLSAAKKMNTTLLYKGKKITQSKMIDVINEAIKESKEEHLLDEDNTKGTYYRTYIFMVDDVLNNTLDFDPDLHPPKSH